MSAPSNWSPCFFLKVSRHNLTNFLVLNLSRYYMDQLKGSCADNHIYASDATVRRVWIETGDRPAVDWIDRMVKRRSTGDDRRDLKPQKFAETMKNASVFLRRFLLLVFYANISTTSPFHLEGEKIPKATSPGVKERWSGPSRTRQFHSESISERKHSVLSQGGDLLAMTPSSPIMTSRRPNEREDGGYHRDQEMDVEEDDNEDEERHSQTDSRDHHFSSDCRKRLDVVIESCLDGYERMLRNINPKEQFNDSVKLELCQ